MWGHAYDIHRDPKCVYTGCFLSFLSWVSKTQPNHWTKRMALWAGLFQITRFVTYRISAAILVFQDRVNDYGYYVVQDTIWLKFLGTNFLAPNILGWSTGPYRILVQKPVRSTKFLTNPKIHFVMELIRIFLLNGTITGKRVSTYKSWRNW